MNRPFRWIMHGLFGKKNNPYRKVVAIYGFPRPYDVRPAPSTPGAYPEERDFDHLLKKFAEEALGEDSEEAP